MDHEAWIFNKANVKRCQQIKTRAQLYCDGLVTRRFVKTFKTTKSTHYIITSLTRMVI